MSLSGLPSPPPFPLIVLLTDFGLKDPFVGMMKGVIAGIAPQARCIDLSHEITPHDVREGMLVLQASYRYFPPHTIFLLVVDPGVGSQRRPLLAITERYRFVAPDNGILTPIYQQEAPVRVLHITARQYFLNQVSTTFHGRDLFAPVAAWLATGVDPATFGPEITDPVSLPLPRPQWLDSTTLRGEIVYIDRFGNLMTNITPDLIPAGQQPARGEGMTIRFRSYRIPHLCSSYAEQEAGKLGALFNSWGLLELFFKEESARSILQARLGEEVFLCFPA
ncbi:MAG: hypothetical protein D6736_07855 [Nitrospinota bacterium]|nr:MAG: hypothetical protein D6736_07855 [Nitrospinota bacterium]